MDADDISTISTGSSGESATSSETPPVDTFQLPEDWRADGGHSCSVCKWNGYWEHMFGWTRGVVGEFPERQFERSASAGNLCCAAILALRQRLGTPFDPRSVGEYSSNPSHYVRLYFSCHGPSNLAPPGVTAYPDGGHPAIPEPRSEASLAWAKSRIQDCVDNHNCHAFRSEESSLPKRLVYIPNDVQIKGVQLIIDTSALRVPSPPRYAALSHCWGTVDPPCLTTHKEIDSYATNGIPWDKIPLTYRDAILYTKSLGLEYIWIDSVCIIQRDVMDWEQESTRMFHYYSNAYITLGSTFATNCNEGFFSQKLYVPRRLHLLDVSFRGEIFPLYICRDDAQAYDLEFHEGVTNQPLGREFQLFQRAWVFQERLVSPRLLFFTDKQLMFECYEGRWLQETPMPTERTCKSTYRDLLSTTSSRTDGTLWTDILGAFGRLKITHPKDKLPAMAAVAKQFLSHQSLPHTPEHDYLCGLRKSQLHVDLSWRVAGEFRDIDGFDCNVKEETEPYLAPSWSWASVPQETIYRSHAITYQIQRWNSSSSMSLVTLMEDNVEFAGGDRFGKVLPGSHIVVKGTILDCSWVFSLAEFRSDLRLGRGKLLLPRIKNEQYPGSKRHQFSTYFSLDSPTSHHSAKGYLVKDKKTLKLVTLLCIRTELMRDGRIPYIRFLVLHRNSKNGRYRRLGLGIETGSPWILQQLKTLFEDLGHEETLILE